MFKKNNEEPLEFDKPMPPMTPSMEVRTRSVSVIGPTLKFKGELSANEDLVIEGEIEGTIAHQDKNLTVGKQGRVNADIHAKMVEILGIVNGDIRSDKLVKLAKTAVVKGNIHCSRILMEDGAFFCGTIKMEKPQAEKPKSKLKIAEQITKVTSVEHGAA